MFPIPSKSILLIHLNYILLTLVKSIFINFYHVANCLLQFIQNHWKRSIFFLLMLGRTLYKLLTFLNLRFNRSICCQLLFLSISQNTVEKLNNIRNFILFFINKQWFSFFFLIFCHAPISSSCCMPSCIKNYLLIFNFFNFFNVA